MEAKRRIESKDRTTEMIVRGSAGGASTGGHSIKAFPSRGSRPGQTAPATGSRGWRGSGPCGAVPRGDPWRDRSHCGSSRVPRWPGGGSPAMPGVRSMLCSDRLVGSPTHQFGFELASFIFHFSLSVGGKDTNAFGWTRLDLIQSNPYRID